MKKRSFTNMENNNSTGLEVNNHSLDSIAQRFRLIWDLGEGPQVEQALYDFGTNIPTDSTLFNINSWSDVLDIYHKYSVDDQFIPPIVRVNDAINKKPVGLVSDHDILLYYDFRTDRAKPLTSSFLNIPYDGQIGNLSEIAQLARPSNISMITMTHYDDNFTSSPILSEAFNPAAPLNDTYAEWAGKHGVKQLIVAESEKWRAITWFKDGRRNLGYINDSINDIIRTDKHTELPITIRVVTSRKVAAHIQAPVMRAKEITELLIEGINDDIEDIFANYANADMVGHAMTEPAWFDGVVDAILELDIQLGKLIPIALSKGYIIFITGDHGNAEQMIHPNGKANPAHTTNQVPMIILGLNNNNDDDGGLMIREDATIGDLAPTICQLRGLDLPDCWDRQSFLIGNIPICENMLHRKIMKLVLDGYGINNEKIGNAMASAAEKKGSPLLMDLWMKGIKDNAIFGPAEASGLRCGYPKGEAGTTEFGHVIFDAGRNVYSDVTLIDEAQASGRFDTNPAFLNGIRLAKERNSTFHVMGILSDGMVHSSLQHLDGILKLASQYQLAKSQLSIHIITDGRDVPGDSSSKYVQWLEDKIQLHNVGQINSIWGRGWGKDRDNRWMRIEAAFRSLCEGTAAIHVTFP